MLKEFKEFIARGNVIDLAVGVIIGSAFTAIVTSLTTNLINPLLGIFLGRMNLTKLAFTVGGAQFKYGAFLNAIVNFLIIAFVVFLMVKAINKVTRKSPEQQAAPTPTESYLKDIKELLEKQSK
ncbi:large-conductance mechanosensitive channel protein MscL [Secundilactobacillus malefermentans]|uniref:large-conductance mechanosensitive channel protein MscL n=1 Tax=Secundilactobacillus malefermentans TaxID=176292 RepID=UPI0011CC255C|nr:large-conductance mechanosensitive channel protein MscL [Secundilactobacillus malefermentans]QEA30783.1 large-conductance mechanosensitive channel protein MscL [Secundilactobacillus malefermentans]